MKFPFLLYRGEHFDPNFYHYSNVDIDHSFFFMDAGQRVLLVPRMNLKAAKENFDGTVVAYLDPIIELKKLLKGKRVGIDGANVGFALTERLRTVCIPQDISEFLLKSRMIKVEEEVGRIRKAADITKDILFSLDIRKGMSEADIKKQVMLATLDRGLDPAFKPIIAADRNSSFPHYRTGDARINSMVLIDYGVRYESYSSDLTRCFFLNGGKEKEVYERLQEIFRHIIEKLPDLATGGKLARFSSNLYKAAKLPELPHAIGHGIGLDVHEFPRMGMKSKDALAGSTMAIEPSAYFDDFGVRFEETIYFDGRKAVVL